MARLLSRALAFVLPLTASAGLLFAADNYIGPTGATALADVLGQLSLLQSLHLRGAYCVMGMGPERA